MHELPMLQLLDVQGLLAQDEQPNSQYPKSIKPPTESLHAGNAAKVIGIREFFTKGESYMHVPQPKIKLAIFGGVSGLMATVCYIANEAFIHWKLLFNTNGPYQKRAIHDKKGVL
ncbi:hypothetical protein GH733_013221 [Mirounga leonina]|nr:hypothetical protein GH733_013221 [Mirounga leonina]